MTFRRGDDKGFTLIELLIVIGIIGILAAAVVIFLNPAEQLRKAGDAKRLTDTSSFRQALIFNIAQREGAWDPDGTYSDSCVGESNQRVFVSVPSDNGEADPTDLPFGWSYQRIPKADVGNVDGSGWIPVNLTDTDAGSPLSTLAVDRTNTFASGQYYSYVCSRDGDYEITARMRSERFRTDGAQSTDGGDDIFVYEIGSNLDLDPKAPIAYWDAANWDGVDTVPNSSGSNHDAVAVGGGATIPVPGTDSDGKAFLTFDGDAYLEVPDHDDLELDATKSFTKMAVARTSNPTQWGRLISKRAGNPPINVGWHLYLYFDSNNFETQMSDGSNNSSHRPGSETISPNTIFVVGGRFDRGSNNHDTFFDGVTYTGGTVSGFGDASNALPVRIGREAAFNEGYLNGDIYVAALWDRAITDAAISYQYEILAQ